MGKTNRRLVAGLGMLAASAAIGAAPASAGSPTEVTIKENGGDFSGKVKSQDSGCLDERKVKVYKKKPGKDDYIAMDTTSPDGKWSTGNNGETKGKFYAKVKAAPGCDRAKSGTVKL